MAKISHILGENWSPQRQHVEPPDVQLLNAIRESGITPELDSVILDGSLHRFNTGGRKDKSGWYIAYSDGVPAGKFGCWRQDVEQNWRADMGRELSAAEQMAHTRRMAEAKKARDEAREKLQEAVSDAVSEIWAAAQAASDKHPYLVAKGVKSHGLRVTSDGRLVAPLYDADGSLCSLQYISHDSMKRYHTGGKVSGAFWMLGTLDNATTLYIAEGYATAATIHEQTEQPCIVAYSASNLPAATEQAVKHNLPVVIVADNDKGGIGQKYADQACAKHGASYVMPSVVGMDANDWVQSGRDLSEIIEVKNEWLEQVTTDWFSQPAPLKWLVKGWIPERSLGMLHGPSGVGKTFVMLDIAMSIAAGVQWQGKQTKAGCVVYLAGEGNYGLRSRVAAWMQEKNKSSVEMYVSKSGCDLNTDAGLLHAMQYLRRVAQNHDIKLVVVDTLHRFLHGDENSAEDAKTMIDACDFIKRELDTSVWLVHHTGLSDSAKNRARGSSAWRGAQDVELGVNTNDSSNISALVQYKMKDAEQSPPLQFELKQVTIRGWLDEDGEPVHGAVVSWLGEYENIRSATPIEKAIHAFYRAWQHTGAMRDRHECPILDITAWREYLQTADGGNYSARTAQNKTSTSSSKDSHFLGFLMKSGKVIDGEKAGTVAFIDADSFKTLESVNNILKK